MQGDKKYSGGEFAIDETGGNDVPGLEEDEAAAQRVHVSSSSRHPSHTPERI